MFDTWFLIAVLTTGNGADIENIGTFMNKERCEQTARELSRKEHLKEIKAFCVKVDGD